MSQQANQSEPDKPKEPALEGSRVFLTLGDQALVAQCEVDCYRASGPGGQKRNKTSSAVRLRHTPTGLIAIANEERSQHTNKARALRRLRAAIALHVRSQVDPEGYEPGDVLASCISARGQLVVGRRDARYPQAVAEILDLLTACDLRVSDAAKCLGVTTANLVKLLENDPKLWDRVNQLRAAVKLKPLRKS